MMFKIALLQTAQTTKFQKLYKKNHKKDRDSDWDEENSMKKGNSRKNHAIILNCAMFYP